MVTSTVSASREARPSDHASLVVRFFTDTEDHDLLTAEQQYRHELSAIHELTDEEERCLANQARSGDRQARERLAESLLHPVARIAGRFARQWRLDFTEVLSVGNWLLMEHLDRILRRPHVELPHVHVCYGLPLQLISYFHTATLIHTPRVNLPAYPIVSLDAPLSDTDTRTLFDLIAAPGEQGNPIQTDETRFAALYQAIEALPPRYRTAIVRAFGLHTHASETPAEMAQTLHLSRETVYEYKYEALRLLSAFLTGSDNKGNNDEAEEEAAA